VIERTQTHFSRKTTAEWLGRLSGKVPCAPVQSLTEALSDPNLVDRGTVIEVEHPVFGGIRQVSTPVRAGAAREKNRCAPKLGEDTEAVLRDYLQYSDDRIRELRQSSVI
jgi:crotonobetainyl-CoA:carnitine CoA-transferase CaiB-like acyl-CoA transferase